MSFTATSLASMASLGLQAYGQYSAGKEEQAAYERNATIASMNADITSKAGPLRQFQKQRNLDTAVGRQIAQYAGSGIDVSTGSPLNTMADTIFKGKLDMAIDQYNTEATSRGYMMESDNYRYYGRQAARTGAAAAGLTLLKAVPDLYSKVPKRTS